MAWVLFIVAAVLLVAGFAALVMGRLPYDPMAEPVHTTPDPGLPEDPEAADVEGVRFDTAARGYRTDEVDGTLERLRGRLAEQEHEITRLRRPPAEDG